MRAEETSFRAGDTADAGFVVQYGSIRVSTKDAGGAREITAGAGALIGELALLLETSAPRPRSASPIYRSCGFRAACFSVCSRAIPTRRGDCATIWRREPVRRPATS